MDNRYRHVQIGNCQTKCPNCGKNIKAAVFLYYDKLNDMKLCQAVVFCAECATFISKKKISDESELDIEVDRFPKPYCSEDNEPQPTPYKPTVKCPYCGSKSTKKISTLSRMGSFATFGFAGKKIGKQWHCNNCKSDF